MNLVRILNEVTTSFIGFIVIGLDYFLGDPVYIHLDEPEFDRPAWSAKSIAQARKVEPKWFEAVKERFGRFGFNPTYHIFY